MATIIRTYGLIITGAFAALVPVVVGAVAEHRHHVAKAQKAHLAALTKELERVRTQLEMVA